MNHEELLLKEGAYFFGNRLIYRNQDVGFKPQGSDLVLNADGETLAARLADVTDVVAKPARKKVVMNVAKPSAEETNLSDELSALLGE